MVPVRDIVIIALLKRMGGAQYLEWDELNEIEHPRFERVGEYLVVRPPGDEDSPPSVRTRKQTGMPRQPEIRH